MIDFIFEKRQSGSGRVPEFKGLRIRITSHWYALAVNGTTSFRYKESQHSYWIPLEVGNFVPSLATAVVFC
jgi:hypothetical protein